MIKALLIIDYQNDFTIPTANSYLAGVEKIKGPIEFLVSEFTARGDKIIGVEIQLTEVIFQQMQTKFPHLKKSFIEYTKGQQNSLPDHFYSFKVFKAEQLLAGQTSPFFAADSGVSSLEKYLQDYKISEVHVCGVRTDIGVSSAVRDLISKGYKTVVHLDACFSPKAILKL